MPNNMLTRGAAWLAAQLKQSAGTNVTYQQGQTTLSIIGVSESTNLAITDENGFPKMVAVNIWTFAASDLGGMTPRPGVLITDDAGARWEAMDLPGSACFQTADPGSMLVKIQTKRVG